MRGRILTCVILIGGLAIVLLSKYCAEVRGFPKIEICVDRQLRYLVSQSPNLKGLVVGRKDGAHIAGDVPPFKGEIQYQAQLNGSSVDLFVYWAGDSTNSQITKIESALNNAEPQTLWEQH
jgi:hypothetical protein